MAVTISLGTKGLSTGITIGGAAPQTTQSGGLTIGGKAQEPAPEQSAEPAKKVAAEEQLEIDFPDHAEHSLDGQAILKYHELLSRSSPSFSPDKAREAGLYFGYPVCCINHFIAQYESGVALPHAGTGGFVPCPKCQALAEKDAAGVAALIKNRVCARPYPNSVAAEDIRVLVEGRPTATMLKILRVHMRIDSDAPDPSANVLAAEDDKITRMPRKAYDTAMEYLRTLK